MILALSMIVVLYIDYYRLEKRIVDVLENGDIKNKGKTVIYYAHPCGFGNQFRSLLGSVVFALVTGRRLRSSFVFY